MDLALAFLTLSLIFYPYYLMIVPSLVLMVTGSAVGLFQIKFMKGDLWITIPLCLITLLCLLFATDAYALVALVLLFVYFAGLHYRERLFRFFGLATVLSCLGLIAVAVITGFKRSGGLININNYNIGAAAIIVGYLAWNSKHKWLLSPLVIVALFLSGADEALLASAFIFLSVIIRRDISRKIILPLATVALLLAVCTPLGITYKIWSQSRLYDTLVSLQNRDNAHAVVRSALGPREEAYSRVLDNLSLQRHGYGLKKYDGDSPHNLPLMIADEIGIMGALVWLAVVGYAIFKYKAKYALIAIIPFSLIDNMFWSQIPIYWWAIMGVFQEAKSDYIFKEV